VNEIHGLPRDAEGSPVFDEPWQAQAFAMAVNLHAAGHFTWSEWSAMLADEIRQAQQSGDADRGDTYYHHWLRSLERIVAEKGLIQSAELSVRKQAWAAAAERTPHGKPIEL
jgi:nitrile hydratase accessory protein